MTLRIFAPTLALLFFTVIFVMPSIVSAQGGVTDQETGDSGGGVTEQQSSGGTSLINPLGECSPNENCLRDFLMGILDIVIQIGTIVVVFMLIYVGFLFTTSSVNPTNKDKAKTAFLWTVVGALVLLGAKAIAEAIDATVRALS